jgi:hypothetical protein
MFLNHFIMMKSTINFKKYILKINVTMVRNTRMYHGYKSSSGIIELI